MTPAEYVADRTWHMLGSAKTLRARVGEETLTDLLVLDMLRGPRVKAFRLLATSRPTEARCGADLLVAVWGPFGWSSYAVQAKKLYPDGTYGALTSGDGCREQLRKLDRFAGEVQAVPVYLLYNHCESADAEDWPCARPAVSQLGCTVVPSWHVWRCIGPNARRQRKSFDLLNMPRESLPWRCLFDCTRTCKLAARFFHGSPFRRPEQGTMADERDRRPADSPGPPWPEWLFEVPSAQFTLRDFDRLRSEISSSGRMHAGSYDEVGDAESLYPARLLVADYRG